MGGGVVQEVALHHPKRLLSLTLEDTSSRFAFEADPRAVEVRERRRHLAETQGMSAVANDGNDVAPAPHMPPQRSMEEKERVAAISVDAYLGAWEGLAGWEGTEARAIGIQTPTLIVVGDLDSAMIMEGSFETGAPCGWLQARGDSGSRAFSPMGATRSFQRDSAFPFLRSTPAERISSTKDLWSEAGPCSGVFVSRNTEQIMISRVLNNPHKLPQGGPRAAPAGIAPDGEERRMPWLRPVRLRSGQTTGLRPSGHPLFSILLDHGGG